MSETNPTQVVIEQLEQIAGGSNFSCTDAVDLVRHLSESYEHLVQFSTYVIERVANAIAASNQ